MSVLDDVAAAAAADSPLWEASRLEGGAPGPRFDGVCRGRYLTGLEAIREGYLLHYGRSRLFAQDDEDLALLTGDYLYAWGLTEICATGDLAAVAALAELIAACAARRAAGDGDEEPLWEATARRLGR